MKVKDIIIEEILKEMESGKLIWHCPYFFTQKQNYLSKKPYRGINRWLLAKYSDINYLTFNQIKKLNGSLKAGSKGIKIVFWKKSDSNIPFDAENSEEEAIKSYWILRYYVIFKQSDITGIDFAVDLPENDIKSIENIDSDIIKTGAKINTLDCIPHYNIESNIIGIPDKKNFDSTTGYYSTLFHELIHWTGSSSLLNRFKSAGTSVLSSKESYSKEELIAEIGSAMITNFYNIENDYKNNSAYIQSWIAYLKNNKEEIFTSASKSEQAFNLIKEKIQAVK